MELQFVEKGLPCARQVLCQVKEQEQTQEVRLPDSMPEVGSVLGAWGQVLVRSKSWEGQSVGVCAGVMAAVAYQAEEGQTHWVECWIPMEFNWDIPQTQRDGAVLVNGQLRFVDARPVSARKLLVRASVALEAQISVPDQVMVFQPQELPPDVCFLEKSYPVTLMVQTGEKSFVLEEPLTFPGGTPKPERILRCSLVPEIQDEKIMAGRAVFRGAAQVNLLCRSEDGSVYCVDISVPFSHYDDLDRDYDSEASMQVWPLVTSLEVEEREGEWMLHGGLSIQYQVYDTCMVQVAEDAYSVRRPVTVEVTQLELPAILEQRQEWLEPEASLDSASLVDAVFYPDIPQVRSYEDQVELLMSGRFTVLYYADGQLCCAAEKWEQKKTVPADGDCRICAGISLQGKVHRTGGTAAAQLLLSQTVTGGKGIPMVTGLTLGEETAPDPHRPSLIMRRLGKDSVWEVAKASGSTVTAIEEMNPQTLTPDTLLLIPVR